MMKDIEIKINRETRMVDLSKSIIGNDGENLQGNLVFSFADDFVKGQARLEYVIDDEKKYAFLLKGEDNYYIPIKSVMTKAGTIDMQLVVTEGTNENEIPIFKSNMFYVTCRTSINAEIEEEEEYYSWIKIANTKLNEVDEAIEELASQSNYAKEQGDYAKEQGTNAKNVADDTQKKAEDGKFNGKSLEFIWQGTKLGVRLEGQEEYQFVDLQGVQGEIGATGEPFKIKKTYASVSEMNADFRNMAFGDYVMIASSVDVEDNAKLYTRGESSWIFISDFSGAMGIRGETGLTPNIKIGEVKTLEAGSQAKVTRSGSNEEPVFNFELPKGDKGDDYVLTEEDKVEIGEKVNTEYEKRIAENEKDIIDIESYLDSLTPKASAKGELVHITDALNLPTFETKTSGNVKQEGEPSPTSPQPIEVLEAYNLFNSFIAQKPSWQSGNLVVNEDGSFTLSDNSNSNNYFQLAQKLKDFCPNIKVGDTVYLYLDTTSSSKIVYLGENWTNDTSKKITQAMLDANFIIYGGYNQTDTIKIQVLKEPKKPYLPYGCVGYKVNVKNLLNLNTTPIYVSGASSTFNEPNITITKTSPSLNASCVFIVGDANILNGKTLKYTGELLSGTSRAIIGYADADGGNRVTIAGNTNINSGTFERTITVDGTTYANKKVAVWLYSDVLTTGNIGDKIIYKNVMVSENGGEYEPYQEQIVPLDLKGNLVGKINDNIKDYLVTDKKKYWLVKNVGKVVLNGSENWQDWNAGIGYFGALLDDLIQYNNSNGTDSRGIANYFRVTANSPVLLNTQGLGLRQVGDAIKRIYCAIDNTIINSLADFKSWLSTHNTILYYQLATPEIIELGELPEPIKTFEGVNNIQVLANLDTEIEVTYALDIKKYTDNKLAEISAQII